MSDKEIMDAKCDLLIQQAGYDIQYGYTGSKLACFTQMVSIQQLREIAKYAFNAGAMSAKQKVYEPCPTHRTLGFESLGDAKHRVTMGEQDD